MTLPLLLCSVKLRPDFERRNCFEIVSPPDRSLILQAESEEIMHQWVQVLHLAPLYPLLRYNPLHALSAALLIHEFMHKDVSTSFSLTLSPTLLFFFCAYDVIGTPSEHLKFTQCTAQSLRRKEEGSTSISTLCMFPNSPTRFLNHNNPSIPSIYTSSHLFLHKQQILL